MNPESLKSSFTDLVSLAEKVSQLNPDAGEIGAGMLRELVSLARRALGEEASPDFPGKCGVDWWISEDGRKWEYTDKVQGGCDFCAFGWSGAEAPELCGEGNHCLQSGAHHGKTWQRMKDTE